MRLNKTLLKFFIIRKVFTADSSITDATAFVVRNGKFIYVGNDKEALKYGKGRDLKGKRVIPGLIESHAHPIMATSVNTFKGFYKFQNAKEPQKAMEELHEAYLNGTFKDTDNLFIAGAAPNEFINLTAKEIDNAISDKAVAILSLDGHSLWMNSLMMKKLQENIN